MVECRVTAHPFFGRDGDNLTVRVPITFAEAVLGATVEVPTLDGGPVKLRLKPGTQSGSRHRVRHKGIEARSSRGASHGDLIVTVDVQIPSDLTDEQRQAVESFAAATTTSPRRPVRRRGR